MGRLVCGHKRLEKNGDWCNACYQSARRITDPEYAEQKRLIARRAYHNNKHKHNYNEKSRRLRYGLSQAEYDLMIEKQNGFCAMCNKSVSILHIDHNHATGKIRGLLCRKCNVTLGYVEDEELMNSARKYLSCHTI